MKITSVLDQIDLGNYALPVFQRGYVWNRDQVRRLMASLYKGYPIGSLLIWNTRISDVELLKGSHINSAGNVQLILDGQQRITSLYGIVRGKKPPFFEGDPKSFLGLYFHAGTETFEFYAPMKMDNDPLWISVTELLVVGVGNFLQERPHLIPYLKPLNRLDIILQTDLPIIEVTGEDKTIDVVVEIFNNVNSSGTKLSKGDLALAKLTAEWPHARDELNEILKRFKNRGFSFSMDWLLRNITVYLTSQPYFSGLVEIDIHDYKSSLSKVERILGTILDHIGSRLGLDHDRVLKSHFAFPIILQLVKDSGGKITDYKMWNKILYWYIHTFLWGRYSSSTESTLAQDLNILKNGEGIDGLINMLRKNRGSLEIKAEDFLAWGAGSRSYPLLYLLTRVRGSKDWFSGVELKRCLLGNLSSLEVHHIFPRSLLYKAGFDKTEVNTLANYTFLTKETNLLISNRNPQEYLVEIASELPDALKSHWVPMDSELWNIEKYQEFLEARRLLLAEAANEFLNSLYNDELFLESDIEVDFAGEEVDVPEEELIIDLAIWMEEIGLKSGELNYELVGEHNKQLAVFDLAWPDGIQEGLSNPVAVLIDEPDEVLQQANESGYKYFVDVEEFKSYVEKDILG